MPDRRDPAAVLEPSAPSRDDPRRRIIDALVRTVAHSGYDRTTIDHVLAATACRRPCSTSTSRTSRTACSRRSTS